MTNADIIATVRKLRAADRLEIVDAILDSLDEPDPAIDAAWAMEAQERHAAYVTGKLPLADLDPVLDKFRRS